MENISGKMEDIMMANGKREKCRAQVNLFGVKKKKKYISDNINKIKSMDMVYLIGEMALNGKEHF